MDCFAASVALRERKSVATRLHELGREPESSWRDREIGDLQRYLLEVDGAVARHREAARLRGH
jgi:hypothetical protein